MTIHHRRDDYPNPWRIQVRGHPARRESISWREAIRDAVTDTYPQAPFTSPPLGTKFTVEVIFRMTPEDLARPAFDLDNFAKPVLDTVFTSQHVAGLTGVPERSGYAASKHALIGFFDSLRIELRGSGVDVSVIAPDFVVSEIHKRAIGPDGEPLR